MLTKIKRFLVLVVAAIFVVVLTGCDSTAKDIEKAIEELNVTAEITEESIVLPNVYVGDSTCVWTSSDENVLSIDGSEAFAAFTDKDQNVTLTITVTAGDVVKTKTFNVVVKALAAPTKITVDTSKLPTDDEGVILKVGKSYKLGAVVEPENAYGKVVWSTNRSKVAKVEGDDENGYTLVAVGEGKCKLTVKSASNDAVGETIDIFVATSEKATEVLTDAVDEIKAKIPTFIYETQILPSSENEYITVKYIEKSTKLEVENNEYVWRKGDDRREEFELSLTFRGVEIFDTVTLQVVNDPDDNEFLAIEEGKEKMNEQFASFVNGTKISSSQEVITYLTTQIGAEDSKKSVKFEYEAQYLVGAYNPVTFKVAEDATDSSKTVTTLAYTKPNDDVSFTIRVDVLADHVSDSMRFTVKAQGYTKDEIVQYMKENSFPQVGEDGKVTLTCANASLAARDLTNKFQNMEVTWSSSNTAVLSDAGKFVDITLKEDTDVTLTATINYKGTVDSSYAFTETVEYKYLVKPAENNSQIVAYQLSGILETEEFLNKITYFPFGDLTRRTSEEVKDENIMPLPNTIGDVAGYETDLAAYKDVAIVWATDEEGVIDANHKLLKQYLRYHEVYLTYSVTVDGATSTNEILINIGVAKVKNTKYYGGWFAIDQSDSNNTGDALSALSKFDATVGKLAKRSQYWGTNIYGAKAAFGGYTYYIDVTDEDGVTTRHQFFTQLGTQTYLGQEGTKTVDGASVSYNNVVEISKAAEATNSDITEVNGMWVYKGFNTGKKVDDTVYYVQTQDTVSTTMNDNNTGGNWGLFFINNTDKDIMVPMSPYTGGSSPKLDADGAAVKYNDASTGLADRENAYSFDGYRVATVMDKDGNVVLGNKSERIQNSAYFLDANGELTYFITIPAGGYGMSYKTMYNNLELMGNFAVMGSTITLSYYEPYNLSADGSTDGLLTYLH